MKISHYDIYLTPLSGDYCIDFQRGRRRRSCEELQFAARNCSFRCCRAEFSLWRWYTHARTVAPRAICHDCRKFASLTCISARSSARDGRLLPAASPSSPFSNDTMRRYQAALRCLPDKIGWHTPLQVAAEARYSVSTVGPPRFKP